MVTKTVNQVRHEDDGNGELTKHVSERGVAGNYSARHITDITNTRQKKIFAGARSVTLQYRLEPGETQTANQWVKYCFNAASDADADGKLAAAEAHFQLFPGDDIQWNFDENNLCERIDLIANAAVGSEETQLQIIGG